MACVVVSDERVGPLGQVVTRVITPRLPLQALGISHLVFSDTRYLPEIERQGT
jgi:hypothetical protein